MSTRTRGILAPHVLSPFRKTRSGTLFSPWTRNIGTLLHVPDFDLEDALQALAMQTQLPASDAPTPTSSPEDPDNPDLAPSVVPAQCEAVGGPNELDPVDHAGLEELFKGFERMEDAQKHSCGGHRESVLSESAHSASVNCARDPTGKSSVASVSPSPGHDPTPARAHVPAATSLPIHKSKKKYHADMRAKEHRRKRRTAETAKDSLLYPDGRAAKGCAVRHIYNALAMYADTDLAQVFTGDDAGVSVDDASKPLDADYSLDQSDVPVTSTGYTARFIKPTEADLREISVDEARRLPGFRYIRWSGRVTRGVLDRHRRLIVLLDGRPNDPKWDSQVNGELSRLIPIVAGAYRFAPGHKPNRRGNFETISCGISFGGGQKRVGNFALSKHNCAIWSLLLKLRAVRRVANFANTSMKVFFPRIHAYYARTLGSLCEHDPKLQRNFPDNSCAAISINLGPQAVAVPHTDHLNLANGLCAITALGNYDPVKGGHLILWDLRLIIEFPPGSTILIPSAILKHSNTKLGSEDERRYAFLQYSAGGLFRYVDCGFQTKKDFLAAGNVFEKDGEERWKEGIAMFSTWEELRASSK